MAGGPGQNSGGGSICILDFLAAGSVLPTAGAAVLSGPMRRGLSAHVEGPHLLFTHPGVGVSMVRCFSEITPQEHTGSFPVQKATFILSSHGDKRENTLVSLT